MSVCVYIDTILIKSAYMCIYTYNLILYIKPYIYIYIYYIYIYIYIYIYLEIFIFIYILFGNFISDNYLGSSLFHIYIYIYILYIYIYIYIYIYLNLFQGLHESTNGYFI